MTREYVIEGEERSFPVPPATPVTEQYTIEAEVVPSEKAGTWSTLHVKVLDNQAVIDAGDTNDGTSTPRVVFEYDRNYTSMYGTFHPFRQLQDGVWHDYALISTQYVRFEVVDLEKGEIVAVEAYPKVTQEFIDSLPESSKQPGGWAEKYKLGDDRPGSGFCPTGFRVFDWNQSFSGETVNKTMKDREGKETYLYSLEDLNQLTGQWAVYYGCHWGDDSSYKLRYIDLSKIKDGIVTADDRFGYFPVAGKLDSIDFYVSSGSLIAPLETTIDLNSGKSVPEGVKWMTEDEADEF